MQQAVLTPEGVRLIAPTIGFNPIYTKKDRIRWTAIYLHGLKKGMTKAKAEAVAFLEVWKMRDPHIIY
jgi:hypothetical protein